MIVIIEIIQERLFKRVIIGENIQEVRLLATFLVDGGSQCWSGFLATIQYHAYHGGSHIAGRIQKKLR